MATQKTKKQILEEVNSYEGKKVKLAITDMDGVLRGKIIHIDKFNSIVEGCMGFCDVVFGWDMVDRCYDDVKYTGWHTGYPDAKARLDLQTYRRVPWDDDIPFFLVDFEDEAGKQLDLAPRNVLKRIRKKCADMGYQAFFSQEFEWFNFRETPAELHEREFRSPRPITPGMFGYSLLRADQNQAFFNDLFDFMRLFEVPLEGLHTETGPGVYEAAILYAEVLEAADRAVLFKGGVKEIGGRHGIMPTFMAKWNEKLPGCSGHVHQSLWNAEGTKNLFHDPSDSQGMSKLMRQYLAGQLHCMREFLPLFAPTVNSFKRLVEGAWAPTTLTWGIDNRTVGIRILPGSAKSTRIEFRVTGSDANPYLAMAGSLAAGLYGIEKGLSLDVEATQGNGYLNKQNGCLDRNLYESAMRMRDSKLANEMFGESFVQHFTETRIWEWKQFSSAVTDWELKRYFEII